MVFPNTDRDPSYAVATAPSGTVVAISGTLYNPEFLEISDTASNEAVAYAIAERLSHQSIQQLMRSINGDLAIAAYDPATDCTWLAGDRFGSTNIYFIDRAGRLTFADSLKSIAHSPDFDRKANLSFLLRFGCSHYRMITNDLTETPYQCVPAVPPAHIAKIDSSGVHLERYWSMDGLPATTKDDREIAADYRNLLLDSVRRRVSRTANPGFTLSGGMDSSSVLSSAAHINGGPFPAFTVTYDDPEFDERDDVVCMKDRMARPWNTLDEAIEFDVLGAIGKLYDTHIDLVPTGTWLSHFDLCRVVAEKGHTHIFDGLGGDELNAGEYEYFPYFFADLARTGHQDRLRQEVDTWIEHHDHPIFRKSQDIALSLIQKLTDPDNPGRNLPDLERLNRYAGTANPDLGAQFQNTPALESPFDSFLLNRTYQDLSRETLPLCLRIQRQNADAFGLRPVSPFLDYRLVELMFSVPPERKIRNGVTKVLLRDAMTGILPDEVRTRPNKRGWNVPAHTWFTGKTLDNLEDMVRSREYAAMALFDKKAVLTILQDHRRIMSGGLVEENHMMFMWQLANLLVWADKNAIEF